MKSLNHHHLLYPMQCCLNGVLIEEVPNTLAPILSETMYDIQIEDPFLMPPYCLLFLLNEMELLVTSM